MARDDQNNPPYEDDFYGEGHKDSPPGGDYQEEPVEDAVYEEPGAEPAEEWQDDQPLDDFEDNARPKRRDPNLEDGGDEEAIEADGAHPDDGPLEDDYVQQVAETDEHYEPTAEDTVVRTREAMAMRGQSALAGLSSGLSGLSGVMKYLPYGAVALVLAVLGFFGFQQIAGMAEKTEEVAANVRQDTQAGLDKAAETLGEGAQQLGDATRQAVRNVGDTAQAAAQGAASHLEQGAQAAANILPAPPSGNDIMQPAPANPLPANPAQALPAPALVNAAPQPAPAPVAVPVAPASADLESRLAEMTRQLDDLKQTNSQLQQQLQGAPASDTVKTLEGKLAELEAKLAAKETAPTVDAPTREGESILPSPVKAAVKKPARDQDEAGEAAREPKKASSSKKKGSTDFMAAKLQREENKGRSSKKRAAPRRTAEPDVASTNDFGPWVLRSAQPGVAWLSKGMSSDLRRVVPGDKVQGIGTIISIRQEAGRWLVEGTQSSTR